MHVHNYTGFIVWRSVSCKIQSYGLQLVSWEAFYLVIVLLNVAINILSPILVYV